MGASDERCGSHVAVRRTFPSVERSHPAIAQLADGEGMRRSPHSHAHKGDSGSAAHGALPRRWRRSFSHRRGASPSLMWPQRST
jgi:hypothetical protein